MIILGRQNRGAMAVGDAAIHIPKELTGMVYGKKCLILEIFSRANIRDKV